MDDGCWPGEWIGGGAGVRGRRNSKYRDLEVGDVALVRKHMYFSGWIIECKGKVERDAGESGRSHVTKGLETLVSAASSNTCERE